MHQRRGMNDLDDSAQPHRAASLVIEKLGRKKKQRGADPLAAAVPQILADFRDRLHAGDGILPEFALKRRKILVQQVEYFFSVNDRRRAQSSVLNLCPLC